MKMYTFIKDGKFLYFSISGGASHLPLFQSIGDAAKYAAQYGVRFDDVREVNI